MKGYIMARSGDVPRVLALLNQAPESVLVKRIYTDRGVTPITEYARGPFALLDTSAELVLCGIDVRTGKPAQMRIRVDGVVEVKREPHGAWTAPSHSGVRICIPEYDGDTP